MEAFHWENQHFGVWYLQGLFPKLNRPPHSQSHMKVEPICNADGLVDVFRCCVYI